MIDRENLKIGASQLSLGCCRKGNVKQWDLNLNAQALGTIHALSLDVDYLRFSRADEAYCFESSTVRSASNAPCSITTR